MFPDPCDRTVLRWLVGVRAPADTGFKYTTGISTEY